MAPNGQYGVRSMRFDQRMRRWLSAGLVLAVLLTQFATAAHACLQALSADQTPAATSMPCALHGSSAAPATALDESGVCLQHCQSGAQTVDTGHVPALSAPVLVTVLALLLVAGPLNWRGWAERSRNRDRSPPPALSILHCCYRI